MKMLFKIIGFGFLAFLLLGIIGVCLQDDKPMAGTTAIGLTTTKEPPVDRYKDLGERINLFSMENYRDDQEDAMRALTDLATLRGAVNNALADSAYAKKAKAWEATIIKKQVSAFPVIRKKWIAGVKEKMWENDIDVSVSGPGNTIVTLTGGLFAANKNKAATQESIEGPLKMLHFKQVHYKWYSGEDGNTYYEMKPNPDSEF